MVVKVEDLTFDCSTWDANGENFQGKTGIMFDSCVEGTNENGEYIFAVEVQEFLDKELAEVCETDVNTIKEEIYMDNVSPLSNVKGCEKYGI